jgi:hypothetical protein
VQHRSEQQRHAQTDQHDWAQWVVHERVGEQISESNGQKPRATAKNSAPSSTSSRCQPGEPPRPSDRLSSDACGLTMTPSLTDGHTKAVTNQLMSLTP